jgi:Na+/melibiose symporter-like transporter
MTTSHTLLLQAMMGVVFILPILFCLVTAIIYGSLRLFNRVRIMLIADQEERSRKQSERTKTRWRHFRIALVLGILLIIYDLVMLSVAPGPN